MITDFDFLLGKWQVFNTRLTKWLSDCSTWIEFESVHEERKLTHGTGNVALHQYVFNNFLYERSVLRTYLGSSDFWKIDRLDGMTDLIMSPLQGTFWQNKGSFLSKGLLGEKEVLVWVEWTKICRTYACWEQALSADNGKSWETNWVMEFYKRSL